MVQSIIVWILCVGISAIVLGYLIMRNEHEGFLSVDQGPFVFKGCPSFATSYITSTGDTRCCEGDVVNKKCNGHNVCSLSPNPPAGLKTCSQWMANEWKRRSMKFCPNSMPYYFGPMKHSGDQTSQQVPHGCSASNVTTDGASPQNINSPMCRIYLNSSDEYSKVDSCLNKRKLESMKCPTAASKRSIIESDGSLPALLACSYVSPNNSSPVPIVCYEAERAKVYMKDKLGGDWVNILKEKGMTVNNMLALCPTSQNYYVSGSMKSTDIRF